MISPLKLRTSPASGEIRRKEGPILPGSLAGSENYHHCGRQEQIAQLFLYLFFGQVARFFSTLAQNAEGELVDRWKVISRGLIGIRQVSQSGIDRVEDACWQL